MSPARRPLVVIRHHAVFPDSEVPGEQHSPDGYNRTSNLARHAIITLLRSLDLESLTSNPLNSPDSMPERRDVRFWHILNSFIGTS